VKDVSIATNRGPLKEIEWTTKLKAQDVMTVGDLRGLHEEDWQNLYYCGLCSGLTVFAMRSLKNALFGRPSRGSPKVSISRAERT
jgi:WNK lysine deficient protein kinase